MRQSLFVDQIAVFWFAMRRYGVVCLQYACGLQTAGVLVAMRECGIVCLVRELFVSESVSQVYLLLLQYFVTHGFPKYLVRHSL